MKNLIVVENMSFSFAVGQEPILNGIDFSLQEGEIIGIMGSSGVGKTTLAYLFSGIIPHAHDGKFEGEVYIGGENTRGLTLPQISKELGIVFQDPDTQLFSSVLEEDVAFGPENMCAEWEAINEAINRGVQLTSMEKMRFSSPENMSGGERQMGALASVLALNPKILIFDEAMSQLDENSVEMLKGIIQSLSEQGKGVILIEHDEEKLDIAHKVFQIKDKKLLQIRGIGNECECYYKNGSSFL